MSSKRKTISSLADLEKIVDKTKLKPAATVQEPSATQSTQKKMTQAEYDTLLANETEVNPPHNPNPFDFVFFTEAGPKTYSLDDLNKKYGGLQSGYIEVKLTAKTPVHIVGRQDPVNNRAGKKILKSHFYMQDDQPCIPGSSIRGMLRSFIEAVTNGWVSQAKDTIYGKEPVRDKNTRHIEFSSWDKEPHNHKCLNSPTGVNHTASPAIPIAFEPLLTGDRMDIATYLFGYLDSSKDKEKTSARAGKVIIEDAYFESSYLNDYKMVDIEGDAIMGGPRPRANWWYMRPQEVWDRSIRRPNGTHLTNVAHIVGDKFWGRKFYYHQEPQKCIEFYMDYQKWWPELDLSRFSEDQFQHPVTVEALYLAIRSNKVKLINGNYLNALNSLLNRESLYTEMANDIINLPHRGRLNKLKKSYDKSIHDNRTSSTIMANLIKLNRCLLELAFPAQCPKATYWYYISCLKAEQPVSFRIYFDRVPAQLIQLICTCLCMPTESKMRHKLGYGKAFGYGSVEFSINSAMLRAEKTGEWPDSLSITGKDALINAWSDNEIKPFIDNPSLEKFARILTWDVNDNSSIIFTYPPYSRQNFQQVIQKNEFCTATLPLASPKNTVDDTKAIDVAKALWDKKKPIHFLLYQARAKGYDKIKIRKP